jgi:hypothetical protein
MTPSAPIAGLQGVTTLYHYDQFHHDRLRDILEENRVYCSNPSNFNDPWDCKPCFDPDLVMDAETQAAEAEHFIAGQAGGPKGDAYDEAISRSPFVLKTLIKDFSEGFNAMIPERWGVYCLAKCGDNALMWSHYSHNHTGICLEFTTQQSKFFSAYEVEYHGEYPPFLLHKQGGRPTILISKSDVWKYEQEYRLICPRYTIYENHPLLMEGDYLRIGRTDLQAIILGCQASAETIQKVKQLVLELAPHVTMKHARRSPSKYRLEIESRTVGRRIGHI